MPAHRPPDPDSDEEPFVVTLPPQHRLGKAKAMSSATLRAEGFLMLEEGHCRHDQPARLCAELRLRREQEIEARTIESLRQMVI